MQCGRREPAVPGVSRVVDKVHQHRAKARYCEIFDRFDWFPLILLLALLAVQEWAGTQISDSTYRYTVGRYTCC